MGAQARSMQHLYSMMVPRGEGLGPRSCRDLATGILNPINKPTAVVPFSWSVVGCGVDFVARALGHTGVTVWGCVAYCQRRYWNLPDQCFPNFFARGLVSASKNLDGSSHPC